MKKTAFLFPGQGSQSVGMAKDLYQEYAGVRELFDIAEDVTRTHLARLCFQGPMEDLTRTVNLQPAVTVANFAFLYAVQKENVFPDITAGHSLGEYSALNATAVLSMEDTLRLVHKRGELMHRESEIFKGAMIAVIGLSMEQVTSEIPDPAFFQPGECVTIANHNAETQIVISGDPESVKLMGVKLKEKGGRVMPLKVSGAWHSPLIKGAEEEFRDFLNTVTFSSPSWPVVFNVSADAATGTETIRGNMVEQLCSPVRWYESMMKMVAEGVEHFVEIGPGNVLSGLMKRIVPEDFSGKIYTVNSMKSLELFFKDGI